MWGGGGKTASGVLLCTRDKTGGFGLREQRERRSACSLYDLLAGMACGVAFIFQIHPIQVDP